MRCLVVKRLWDFAVPGFIHLRPLSAMLQTFVPILSVTPSRALVDEKFKVRVENLPPGLPVTLHSIHQSEDKDYWEAYGHYVSDHRGMVSVADDCSFGGTYTGIEAMGLLWSMRPVPGSRKGPRLRKTNVCTPLLVNISVYSGHESEDFREKTPLASTPIERWYIAPGVRRVDIRERGVQGTLFIPPGPGPFPGVLDMWGAGGGLVEYRSSLLASHGYASLALKYISPGEAESTETDCTYFETAFTFLKDHPQVNPNKIGLFGLSLGSIVSIYLAAESPVVKPVCCVSICASHVQPQWQKLSAITEWSNLMAELIREDENGYQIWRGMALGVISDPSNKVDVGKIKCPMLVVNGCDDQNWPVVEYAEYISRRMDEAGNKHLLTLMQYPDTGHLIEPPFSPHFRASRFIKNKFLLWGGQTKPHSDAQEDAWRKILAFLQHHLYSSPTPKAKM